MLHSVICILETDATILWSTLIIKKCYRTKEKETNLRWMHLRCVTYAYKVWRHLKCLIWVFFLIFLKAKCRSSIYRVYIYTTCRCSMFRHRILLYYPVGQIFTRNHSISYHFEDIFNVYFLLKSKMAAKSGENRNFSPLHRMLLKFFPFA